MNFLEENVLFGKFLAQFFRLLGIFYILPTASSGGCDKSENKESENSTTKGNEMSNSTTISSEIVTTVDARRSSGGGPVYSTAASGTLAVPSSANYIISPTENDPSVGWIYRLNKSLLQSEMTKYGLDTRGTTDELRKRFVGYWRNNASRTEESEILKDNERLELMRDSSDMYNRTKESTKFMDYREASQQQSIFASTNPDPLNYLNLNEMLGLPPWADAAAVKRALADLLEVRRERELKENVTIELPRTSSRVDLALGLKKNTRESSYYTLNAGLMAPDRPLGYERYEYQPGTRSHIPQGGTDSDIPDTAKVCNLVRKWNVHFDGNKDPISFIEKLEEKMESYGLRGHEIIKALPEILHGNALLWQRNNKEFWQSYEDFRKDFELQFWPPGYKRKLDDELRRRTQGEREPFREFVIALTTLMRRRGGFSPTEKLDLLYNNMRPEYKLTIRREEILTLSELICRAEHYETYLRERVSYQPPPNPAQALTSETAYHPKRKTTYFPNTASIDSNIKSETVKDDVKKYDRNTLERPSIGEGFRVSCARRDIVPHSPKHSDSHQFRGERYTQNKSNVPICWNCEKKGHVYRECYRKKRLRCYFCKKDNQLTNSCECRSENYKGAQIRGGRLSSPQTEDTRPPQNGKRG